MTGDKSLACDGCECATPTLHRGVNKRALPMAAAHVFWESVVINAGCDVVMAAAASIILL